MSISSLALFVAVYVAAVATPGPGIASLVARVLGLGLVGIAPFIAGFVVADLIWFSVAATGLAVLAHEFAGLFIAVKFAGIAYLLFIAWKFWTAPPGALAAAGAGTATHRRAFLAGLTLTLSNPKVIVFFLSIMPLAVDVKGVTPLIALELMATIVVCLTSVLTIYALAANRARGLFASPRASRILRRGAAGVIASAAVAIATR